MTPHLEKIARAIYEAEEALAVPQYPDEGITPWGELPEYYRADQVKIARAALSALLPPSEEMVGAMVDLSGGWPWDFEAERKERAEVLTEAFTVAVEFILSEKPSNSNAILTEGEGA